MFGVVPKTLWEKRAPADERNRILLAMRPLLVRPASGPLMIIDAGAGDKMDAKSSRDLRLRSRGASRSHAGAGGRHGGGHRDRARLAPALRSRRRLHARGRGGRVVPRFPNARYVINRGEWEDATHPHERNRASYLDENYVPLQDAGVVQFMEGDGEVMPGVRVRRTGGHTRWHQIVYIESQGRTAVFTADLMPTTAHIDVPWIMGYDLYPMDTLEFKRAFVREAHRTGVPDLLRARPAGRGRIHPREGPAPVRRAREVDFNYRLPTTDY